MASHSWGDNVFRNFLVWVTEDNPDWVERHIHAYVNIAGPVLGVAKSMTSLLSGLLKPWLLSWAFVSGFRHRMTHSRICCTGAQQGHC